MGRKYFRKRQVKNKPRHRRSALNKLFWWFACLRPSDEDVDTEKVTTRPSPALTGIESHQTSGTGDLQSCSSVITTNSQQSSKNEASSDQDERNDCLGLPDPISTAVHHISSICSMMGFPDIPIFLPDDLEVIEDSFGMPVFLGAGNYGAVQLMRIKTTNRLCAVKSQHRHFNERVGIQNFFREVRVLNALEGIENIPVFYGLTVSMDGGTIPEIVQEYIGDDDSLHPTSLYDAIEQGKISEEQSLQAALQVSRTVQDMHSRGWLHCDLKGDNILLQFDETIDDNQWDIFDIDTPWEHCDGFTFTETTESTDTKINIKLIDFGLSCHVDDRQEHLQYSKEKQIEVLETCEHVAPEVVKGQSVFTSSSDVYALGLLFRDMSRISGDFLDLIGRQCMNMKTEKRPEIDDVVEQIEFELLQKEI